jgi:DNA-binding SARP family transcriptional activator
LSQSYGLGYVSHEAVSDKRTGLDLFPDKSIALNDNFKLSFEMCFFPGRMNYYGYLFRIIENEKRNIDLISTRVHLNDRDSVSKNPKSFKLVSGDHFTNIGFNISDAQLLNSWTKVTLEFDFDHDQLILNVNGKNYTETHAQLKKNGNYKFLFGINNYLNFKIHDEPPVKIRNIKIDVNNRTKYSWPLNEIDGNIAHETISHSDGKVSDPSWMGAQHHNWSLVKTISVKGIATAAYNPTEDAVYIIGRDSLWCYHVKDLSVTAFPYNSGKLNLLLSNASIYNDYNHTLYNYYVDRNHKTVTSFNFATKKWDKNYNYIPMVDYLQANNFFSSADSSLYVVGGYGQFTYKNKIQRYSLPTSQWQDVTLKGDTLYPRYLSAIGTTQSGNAAYILGGYGSHTGQQMLNPQNFYDLLRFDVKTHQIKKLFDLKQPAEDFAFVNQMVIDEKAQTFSALVFPNNVYDSHLRLLVGSLKNPDYQIVGDAIPYSFFDGHSAANLFYSKPERKLIAVTLFSTQQSYSKIVNDQYSKINIYTLLTPPNAEPVTIIAVSHSYWLIISLAAVLIIILLVIVLKRRSSKRLINPETANPSQPVSLPVIPESIPATAEIKQNAILLFGDLKLYTSAGEDITKSFTSLIKELFLAIFINSIKSGRGVSPEKLLELLWVDKSEWSAKNNRSANLSRLKSLLGQMENVQLSKNTGNWKIEIDFNEVYVDYHRYLQIVADKKTLDKKKIISLMDITQRGGFLSNAEYPWLDHIKSALSDEIIDIYLNYAHTLKMADDPEFLIRLANAIFYVDPINEDAMAVKCRALSYLGKHSLAKATFITFKKEYLELYGEEFKKDFQAVLDMQQN